MQQNSVPEKEKPRNGHMSASLRQKMIPGFTLVDTCRFRLRTVEEADVLSRFASELFCDPARAQAGLYELLLNAIEHGCLGMGAIKSQCVEAGTWRAEIARRQNLPENRKKCVDMVVARKEQGVFAIVTDPGEGFAWKDWLQVDPARAGQTHGRGIARVRSISFDALAYNEAGNQAVAHMRQAPPFVW